LTVLPPCEKPQSKAIPEKYPSGSGFTLITDRSGITPQTRPVVQQYLFSRKMKTLIIALSIITTLIGSVNAQGLSAQERRSIIVASQRYPDLMSANTPHAKAFEKLLSQSIAAKSVVFRDPNWPLLIAQKAQQSLPALQQGRTTVGRVAIEKYEDAISEMMKSKNPRLQQYAQLEQAAHQAELAGDAATAANIRAQQAQLQALGRIEQALHRIEGDIFRIKQELGIP
jgi:hypothetical protein